jgi:hypothetical protein
MSVNFPVLNYQALNQGILADETRTEVDFLSVKFPVLGYEDVIHGIFDEETRANVALRNQIPIGWEKEKFPRGEITKGQKEAMKKLQDEYYSKIARKIEKLLNSCLKFDKKIGQHVSIMNLDTAAEMASLYQVDDIEKRHTLNDGEKAAFEILVKLVEKPFLGMIQQFSALSGLLSEAAAKRLVERYADPEIKHFCKKGMEITPYFLGEAILANNNDRVKSGVDMLCDKLFLLSKEQLEDLQKKIQPTKIDLLRTVLYSGEQQQVAAKIVVNIKVLSRTEPQNAPAFIEELQKRIKQRLEDLYVASYLE